ncbi:hypothetical protein FPQ18DRAFT_388832 [Pyronema domesticum]|nr:hypothetical protein FPQ18DRAFT_388832 [Pyronema domesticum]
MRQLSKGPLRPFFVHLQKKDGVPDKPQSAVGQLRIWAENGPCWGLVEGLHGVKKTLGILAGALQVPEDIEIIEEPADEIKSEADTESSADEPPEEDVVDETTSEICHSVASLFRLTVAIQNLSSRDRMERMERIDKSAYESFDISHIREKHPLSEEGQYLTERLGKANTKRRQLLEYNEKHHEKIVGRRTEKEKEKEDVGEEDYAPIQTEAEEPPIDFHEHDYIPEAATSTVQTETSTVYGSSFRAFDTRAERGIESVQPCPLCGEEYLPKKLQKHLARHMEQIALFIVPGAFDDEEEDEDDEDDQNDDKRDQEQEPKTPLEEAVQAGRKDVVRSIVEKARNVKDLGESYDNAVGDAQTHEHEAILQYLLKEGGYTND